ncbi:hypothetical protein BDB00DRAFT_803009 [Zychaea mexicana]|uniref:uncharacterized protein n=1 Tax=Zychaea mexicana TaxID=64656 RepID=UPI0022FF1244|nr:uncharacterized protein BDB00DRAFT_803009 [Zychaea mexicana]KAI9498006.1 hypothetical protein BDB00DRAFT_803009 [Zychaea mexicana]
MFNGFANTTSAPLAPYDQFQRQTSSSRSSNSDSLTLDQVTHALDDCHCVINDQRDAFQRLITKGRKVIAQKTIQNEELQYQVKLLQAENSALLELQAKEQSQRAMSTGSDKDSNNNGPNKDFLRLYELVMKAVNLSKSTATPMLESVRTTTATQEGSPPIDIEDIERQLKTQQHKNEKTQSDLAETRSQLSAAEQRLTGCLNSNVSLMREVEGLKNHLHHATEENNTMRQQLQQSNGSAGTAAALKSENQELCKALDELKISFNVQKAQADGLRQNQEQELIVKQREVQVMRDEISDLGRKYASLELEHSKISMEHVIMKTELAAAEEETKKMEEELTRARKQAKMLNQNLEEAQQYINRYYVSVTHSNQTADAHGHYQYSNYNQYAQYH